MCTLRYLGNKDSIVDRIENLLESKELINRNYVFFDAFCGTGTVSKKVSDKYDLVINDNLLLASVFTYGSLVSK